ncbi:hypothetical protein [Streptomyces sp. WAC08241]|uniref:hypothetical protein n=1 Tax=Streptomyces sp. WAC08241 TaxID=2487421 RepID=UPI0021AED3A4|nr:hypothetical protein [Streptomyces sp. WAC08241]
MLAIEEDALRRTCTSGTGWPRPRRTETEAVQTDRGATGRDGAVPAALDGVRTGRIVRREPSLEDAYIAIVEEAAGAREDAVSEGASA